MKPVLDYLRSKSAKVSACLTLAMCAVLGAASAQEPTTATMDTIRAATTTQLTTVQQALLQLIQDILPVALVVMGSVLVVTLGIRLFRRFAG